MKVVTRRMNHQAELRAKQQSFRLAVNKKEDGSGYVANVVGQNISAEGATEALAVRNVKDKADAMFKSGELGKVIEQKVL